MDPLTLVISALAAGATTGLTGAAGAAVADAYAALKNLIGRKLAAKGNDAAVVDQPQKDPEQLAADLAGKLTAGDIDSKIQAAAAEILKRVDPAGTQAGKYVVNVKDSQGAITGDNNTITQTFN